MLLLIAGAIALTAERLSANPRGPAAAPVGDADALGDIGGFMEPVIALLEASPSDIQLRMDPFDARPRFDPAAFPVASGLRAPTVNASGRPGRQLTAILIADDRPPVAVIDGAVVNAGDVLPDGAEVASIRTDRVSLREKNGQWRVITIQSGRQ